MTKTQYCVEVKKFFQIMINKVTGRNIFEFYFEWNSTFKQRKLYYNQVLSYKNCKIWYQYIRARE